MPGPVLAAPVDALHVLLGGRQFQNEARDKSVVEIVGGGVRGASRYHAWP